MKKDRKNIILQSLASMLEERNLSKITTASLAEKSKITEAAASVIFDFSAREAVVILDKFLSSSMLARDCKIMFFLSFFIS